MAAAYVPSFASSSSSSSEQLWKVHSFRSSRLMMNNIVFALAINRCFCSYSYKHNQHNHCCRALHSDSEVNSKRRFMNDYEYQKVQLVSDLGMEEGVSPLEEVHSDAGGLVSNGFEGAYQPGNPLGFYNRGSPRDQYVLLFYLIWNCSSDEGLDRMLSRTIVDWLEKHFPGLFQEIHFALHGKSRPKSEICRSLGAKVLIDDNPRYAIECAELGVRVLLFDYDNSYPWCKVDPINEHPFVTKVYNWHEVEQRLAKLTDS